MCCLIREKKMNVKNLTSFTNFLGSHWKGLLHSVMAYYDAYHFHKNYTHKHKCSQKQQRCKQMSIYRCVPYLCKTLLNMHVHAHIYNQRHLINSQIYFHLVWSILLSQSSSSLSFCVSLFTSISIIAPGVIIRVWY